MEPRRAEPVVVDGRDLVGCGLALIALALAGRTTSTTAEPLTRAPSFLGDCSEADRTDVELRRGFEIETCLRGHFGRRGVFVDLWDGRERTWRIAIYTGDLEAVVSPTVLPFDVHSHGCIWWQPFLVMDLDGDGVDEILAVRADISMHVIAIRNGRFVATPELRFGVHQDLTPAGLAPLAREMLAAGPLTPMR